MSVVTERPLTPQEVPPNLSFDERVKLLQLTLDLAEKAADRFWTRFAHLLTINAGLMAFASFVANREAPLIGAGVGIFGCILSVIWYRMHQISEYYERRFQVDAMQLIDDDKRLAYYLRTRSSKGTVIPRPTRMSSTSLALAI
jgi:hypothetical protein